MTGGLLTDWAAPGGDCTRRVVVRQRGARWEGLDYVELGRQTRVIAGALAATTRPGDVVVLLTGQTLQMIAGFFGAVYAGAVPAVLPTPRIFEKTAPYAERIAAMAETVGATILLASDDLAPPAEVVHQRTGVALIRIEGALASPVELDAAVERLAGDDAMIQFTSGSSGPQRGVVLTRGAIESHLEALRAWLVADSGDVSVSWLPAHHDMGLVGLILLPTVHQAENRLLAPEDFVRDPLLWLQAMSDHRATVGACPPFGLDHCVRAMMRRGVPDVDLRSMRQLVVGAERVTAGPLERFIELTAPRGFDPAAILPAYGLAEAVLGVTGTLPGKTATKVGLRPETAVIGQPIEIVASAPLFDGSGEPDWLVGSGSPLPGLAITVTDDDGATCSDAVLGHIAASGPSIAAGYVSADGPQTPWPAGGPLPTGDVGFVIAGELFVVGRHGDALKVRGRAIFAESIEAQLNEVPDGPRRFVVVMGALDGRDCVIVVCEGVVPDEWLKGALRITKKELQGGPVQVTVARVPRGTIQYTSSAKPRRRPLWASIAGGDVALDKIASVSPSPRKEETSK